MSDFYSRGTAHDPLLSPELRLLTSLALVGAGLSDRLELKTGFDSMDWPQFCRLGRWHRLAAFALAGVKSVGSLELPQMVTREFEASHTENTARSLLLQSTLLDILQRFHQDGIRAMPLKGSVLVYARNIYGHLGLREMYDLDIMVDRAQLPRAVRMLKECRFSAPNSYDKGSPSWATTIENHHRHSGPMISDSRAMAVDLHHTILNPRIQELDPAVLWDASQKGNVVGSPCVVPTAEALLLHLCLHFASDRLQSRPAAMSQLIDIRKVIETERGLDWNWIVDVSEQASVQGLVATTLACARELVQCDIPKGLRGRRGAWTVDDQLLRLLVSQRVVLARPPMMMILTHLRREGLGQRAFPRRGYLATTYADVRTGTVGQYTQHLHRAITVAARPFLHPRAALSELLLQRRLRSLYRGHRRDHGKHRSPSEVPSSA